MRVLSKVLCCQETKAFIGRGALEKAAEEIPEKAKILLVRQDVLEPSPILKVFRNIVDEVVLKGGEEAKDIEVVLKIVERMYEAGIQRSDYVVAFGGGTLTDVTGFAASIYLRGINFVAIPTTLLGMVDAAVGGKNAVNFKNVKNVLGTFYQPRIIVADTRFLDTLPQQEYVNGLAEVIKYGLALDKELYEYLRGNSEKILSRDEEALERVIERSIADKLFVVEQDVFDVKGIRIVLNFGHTVGHLIESLSGFSISHGKAVAVGMAYESLVSALMDLSSYDVHREIVEMLKMYGLPASLRDLGIELPRDPSILKSVVARDKKAGWRGLTIPIVTEVGRWRSVTVDVDSYVEALVKCFG